MIENRELTKTGLERTALSDLAKQDSSARLFESSAGLRTDLPPTYPDLDRFEGEIKQIESQPKENDSTVFVGSSTIRRWPHLEQDFAQYHPYNLGFGGSTLPEINHYFDRLFSGYTPKRAVFYAGTNDIGQEHHSPEDTYKDFVQFEQKFHTKFPKADLLFLSASVPPSNLSSSQKYDKFDELVQQYASRQPHTSYVDVTHAVHDKNNQPLPGIFLPDNLHMTDAGYARWRPIIDQALAK